MSKWELAATLAGISAAVIFAYAFLETVNLYTKIGTERAFSKPIPCCCEVVLNND